MDDKRPETNSVFEEIGSVSLGGGWGGEVRGGEGRKGEERGREGGA
jgi:hypothetical protein